MGYRSGEKNQLINELFGLNITSYDKEDDVYYIKAQLKRRLEELKSLANRQANEANKILSDYEQVLLEDERLKIENGLRVLNKAVNEGNLEDIELFANEIKKQLSDLSPKLKKRNDTLTYAERVLAAVEVEMAEYEGRLNANNEKKLRQLMDIINQKISIKSFSDIYTAASDLDSYWSRLKKNLIVNRYLRQNRLPTCHPNQPKSQKKHKLQSLQMNLHRLKK